MSLGRELKEFSAAFGSTLGTMNAVGAMGDRAERRKARDAANPEKSPEVQAAADRYYKDYGVKPPATPSMALPDRSAADFEDVTPAYREGGLVMDTPGYVRARQTAIAYADETPDLPYREFNEDGQQGVDGQTPLGPRSDESWNEPPVPQPPMNAGEDAPGGATGRGDPVFSAPYSQPGASNAVMPNRQAPRKDAIPPGKSQAIPTRPAAGTGTGTGTGTGGTRAPTAQPAKRKALNDQTRVEAYDPELDGPTEAIPAPAAVTPAGDPPKGAAGPVDYQMTGAAGEGTSPNATADYTTALDGGLKFATSTFNLNGSGAALPGTDRGANAGRQAFTKGTGAATPDMVRAIDQRVNMIPGVPNDEAIWGIRRLEAVYRFYSRRGETDKANKAVFELMQYSAGVAAKYGTAALDQLKANDQRGAVQTVVNGFNQIPNGQRAAINGKEVAITDARTGKTVQQIPITPQTVFNVALGLSDRSLYWDQLMSRAAATMKGRSTRTEAQEELTRAQTELARKRAANVGVKRGGAAGPSPAATQIVDAISKLDDKYGRTPAPTAAPAAAPAPAAGSTDGGDGADPEDPERGAVTDDATMPLGGARPANADGQGGGESGGLAADEERYMQNRARVLAETQPKPSLRITPPRPGQAVPAATGAAPAPAPGPAPALGPTKFDPEGDGYDYETARAAGLKPDKDGHWPSRDPKTGVLLKGRKHSTSKLGDEADAALGYYARKRDDGRYESINPDTVPDVEVVRDGARYTLTPKGNDPRPFDREKPDPGYLKELRAVELAAAQLPPKERSGVQQAVRSRIAAYNAEVRKWEADSKAHTTDEQLRVKNEYTATMAELKAKAKEAYDYRPRPPERAKLVEDITAAINGVTEAATTKGKKLDGTVFGTVDGGKLKHLALEIMTSNPLPDANRAVGIIEQMTRWDDADPSFRFYKPRGRDILGNVVVEVEDYGPVHLRPEAYASLTKLAREQVTAAVKRREAAANPEPSKLSKATKQFGNTMQKRAGETPFDAAQRGRRNAPSSPTSALPTE